MTRRAGRLILLPVEPDAPFCPTGKRPFRTEAEAAGQLNDARQRRSADPTGKTERRYYECDLCRWWHLTHLEKPRRKRTRR